MDLFFPVALGDLDLADRVAVAPLMADSGSVSVTTREEAVALADAAHADAAHADVVAVGRAVIAASKLMERRAGQHSGTGSARTRSTRRAPRTTPTARRCAPAEPPALHGSAPRAPSRHR